MRRWLSRLTLIAFLISLLLPLPSLTSLAASQYWLYCDPIDFGSIPPFGAQTLPLGATWQVQYRGSSPPPGEQVKIQAMSSQADFTKTPTTPPGDPLRQMPCDRLKFWDGAARDGQNQPIYLPVTTTAWTDMTTWIPVTKKIQNPQIGVTARLDLKGNEEPATYQLNVVVRAISSNP